MARKFVTAPASTWGLSQMADSMVELVMRRIGDDAATTRWSAGLALVCFAPPMSERLCKEVHLRLSSILSA
jgi:hypothetical protein